MTTEEFSTEFDVLARSYMTRYQFGSGVDSDGPNFDEYEKSVFLTEAQKQLVTSLYTGKNPYRESFEFTEETRRYLESLVRTKVYTTEEASDDSSLLSKALSVNSVFFSLPKDLAFITLEQVVFDDESLGCLNGKTATVQPVTHDQYGKLRKNPFRGSSKNKVLRIDTGEGYVELISDYKIGSYTLKYLSKPEPIILTELENLTIDGFSEVTDCKLNPMVHSMILDMAVRMALEHSSIIRNDNAQRQNARGNV